MLLGAALLLVMGAMSYFGNVLLLSALRHRPRVLSYEDLAQAALGRVVDVPVALSPYFMFRVRVRAMRSLTLEIGVAADAGGRTKEWFVDGAGRAVVKIRGDHSVRSDVAFAYGHRFGAVDDLGGKSGRFTSPASLDCVHRLRRGSDAVLVGVSTVAPRREWPAEVLRRTLLVALAVLFPTVLVLNTLPIAVALSLDDRPEHYSAGYFNVLAGRLAGAWLDWSFQLGANVCLVGLYNAAVLTAERSLYFLVQSNYAEPMARLAAAQGSSTRRAAPLVRWMLSTSP